MTRRPWLVSAAASAAVAMLAAGYLAARNAARFDELHTLAYARADDLDDLWRSYRHVRDTLPPSGYLAAWLWAQVAGTGLLAARIPVVVAWGAAAGGLTVLARRAGPWASFAAGVVPTATALVFLGAFARPYAPAFAAFVLALVCWERAGDPSAAGGWWATGCGALMALACALHYATAAAAVVVGAIALVTGTDRARGRVRTVVPVVGGLAPVLASAALLPAAVRDQGRLPRSVSPLDAVRFWPSTLTPGWLAFTVLALAGAAVVIVVVRRPASGPDRTASSAGRSGPAGSPPALRRELVWLGWGLVVVVPVAVVAAMYVTSGTYVHRYGVAALAGLALLVAQVVARAGRWHRLVAPALALVLLVGVAAATVDTARGMVSVRAARRLSTDLGLIDGGRGAAPDDEVVVLDEYDLLLLQTYAPDAVADRLVLGVEPVVAGTGPVVDVAARVARAPKGPADGFEVVGSRAEVDALVPAGGPWRATVLDETSYVRPGVARELVRARVAPA